MARAANFCLSLLALATSAVAQDRGVAVAPSGERVLYAPRPDYPHEARVKHLEGRGDFVMHVRQDGTVSRVEVVRSTGHGILDRAVIRAFNQWRFRPGSVDKVALPISFSMPKKT